MFSQTQIKSLKSTLIRGKNIARSRNGKPLDLIVLGELEDALITTGKEDIYELVDEVYPYLDDPFSEFRAEAVRTLGWGSRLGILEFCRNHAYKIWETDPDGEVNSFSCMGKFLWAN